MKNTLGRMLLLGLCALVAACGGEQADTKPEAESTGGPTEANPGAGNISRARLENASQEPEQWLTYGGSYDETRHSTLTKINRDTLSDLGIGWVYEMKKPRGVEATPIVVDGTMYVSGAWSVVYALDARSGEELWVYDPYVSGEAAAKGCCDVVNRGVAVYDGKVYVGVFDGRLEALDASTGEVVWSQVTVDQSMPYT
ncbi:MAG: PQQ-binding-like beta-propeller repeat protein, partial [Luminiphilus sp.]